VKAIRNVTIVAGLICTALSLFLIFFIIQRFVIQPVTLLKDAAVKVAQRRRIEKIPVKTGDELGTLSRSMENMADDIWNYQKEQENWQSKLEDKIKERTRSLLEAEERYRRVVNTISEAIIIADTNGFLLFVNPSCCEIYRYSEKELIGMHISNLVHPEYYHVFERFFVEVREKGSFSGETMDVRKDGSHFFTDARGALIFYDNQECLLAVIRDVTEKKAAEMEREKLIEELQKALDEIKKLQGILPICSHCKQIRDDKGYWSQIESYIGAHSEAKFSHGICPDCAKKLYPEFDLYPETK
jgi:PAS domain S-box-containing protein